MHGREDGQNRRKNRHMWSVASRGLTTTVGVDSCCSSTNSFIKDGRKISVGDCALFKPPNESPPFIGIIHSLALDTESNLKLGVNWLYRPAEVVLGKGVAVEAAPNEVFYSFHRDETPAASLLHPCKVAFLPKGAELRSGVSSFVCWRVYDIANKCLWWLTDKDYLNDQQEEISKLLQKSRIEMHATVKKQQGTHSPRLVNGSAATPPLKNSPDSMQSSGVFSSHVKGKKRDLGDQPSESVKRERLMIADDGDSVLSRSESVMDAEIAKISEKGELVDYDSVERLVQFMQSGTGNSQMKIDLSCRSVLAGVIAGTDRIDCLKWFVQLRGVPVLDEWLQDIHKGKVGDSDSPKDSGKSSEDFLLVVLRALDKLPVNLNALQMCNIGKSVNHLRSHRNLDIQKKARSLVDTWKKRVQAELNSNDAKSTSSQAVSWPTRSRHDLSHGGNKHFGGSSEPNMKNSGQLACAKPGPVKPTHGDNTPRSISQKASPSRSSTPTNCKEGEARVSLVSGGGSEPLQTSVKEEKSSSSSHSQTNSQCSSEHARNIVPSGKEEARNSTAKSKSNKISGSSRHRKSANGLQGTSQSSVQKESRSSRNISLSRISPSEKLPHSVMCENAVASPVVDSNSHKIIVKIPNRGRSPAQSANTGHMEESSCRNSRAPSPSLSEKQDQADASLREKSNACQNIEADLAPSASDGKQHGTVNGAAKSLGVEKTTCLPTGQAAKTKRSSESSMSSMNALIESCVKCSEEPASASVGDDSGMNLLASVAAGEMSRSGVPSPAISPPRSMPTVDNTATDREGGTGCSAGALSRTVLSKEGSQKSRGPPLKRNGDLDDLTAVASVSVSPACMMGKGDERGDANIHMNATSIGDESHDQTPDSKQIANHSLLVQDRVNGECPSEGWDNTQQVMLTCPESIKTDEKTSPDAGFNNSTSMETPLPPLVTHSKAFKDEEGHAVDASGAYKVGGSVSHELKAEDAHGAEACGNVPDGGSRRVKEEHDASSCPVKEEGSSLASTDSDRKAECGANDKEADAGSHMSSKSSDAAAVLGERKGECVPSATNLPSVARLSDTDKKLQFDLNEGFSLDDINNEKPVNSTTVPFSGSIMLTGAAQSTVSTASSGLPASVTIAAAAKRPFVPPEDLLRNKTELGWKGSAATSAFRPAEPRKAFESAVSAYKSPTSDSIASKSARPVLDIDLNVTDEMTLQDICYQSSGQEIADKPGCKDGGLELDLNRTDEAPESVHHSASSFQRLELSASPLRPSSTGILNSKLNTERNFDLNDGPAADEPAMEPLACNQVSQGNLTPQSPFGRKLNNAAVGGLSAWYSPGTTFSAVRNPTAVTSLPDIPIVGAAGSSRVMAGPATALSFNPDFYRGSALSSSPAIPYTTTHFQYPVFPYGTGFPPTSSMPVGSATYVDPPSSGRFCPPPIPSQMLGMAANVSSQGLRPFISSNPDASNNCVAESSQRWGGQSLDLNSGPGGVGRDEALIVASRELPAFNSHAVLEEQARAYHAAGGALKRKEPGGGWDADRLGYKHSSWQ